MLTLWLVFLEYSVPYNGASESVRLSSQLPWASFLKKVADAINVPRKKASSLRFAYKFSSDAVRSEFRHLNKNEHYTNMVSEAVVAKAKLEKSKKQDKRFAVTLKDMRDDGKKGKGKGKVISEVRC